MVCQETDFTMKEYPITNSQVRSIVRKQILLQIQTDTSTAITGIEVKR